MAGLSISEAARIVWHQICSVPEPSADFTGQTIIVTGSNTGLGLEASRHFVQLGAGRVILACRSTERGEAACTNIVASAPGSKCVVEVWPLDLCSFESVRAFCRRADETLDRLDVLVENAGLATGVFQAADGGFETQICVNVVSTFLMALMLLPLLRRTAARLNVVPHLVVVSSSGHLMTRLKADKSGSSNMFDAYKDPARMGMDRYGLTKLLEVLVVRELAGAMAKSGKPPVIVNSVNPGACQSELWRHLPRLLQAIFHIGLILFCRTTEMGSRTLVAAAAAGQESQGAYMDAAVVEAASPWVRSAEGEKMGKKAYEDLLQVLDGIEPGVSGNIQ